VRCRYAALAARFNEQQKALVGKVVETAGTFGPVITECHALVAELDVLLAFAHVSTAAPEPYVRPTLVPPEDGRQRIVLKGCRHPCVERMDGVGYIRNDVELVRGESSLQVRNRHSS
jgi:DNA mismatch repair protein MSH2